MSNGDVAASIANIDMGSDPVEWHLPTAPGPIKDMAGNPAMFEAGLHGSEFLGLKVSGFITPVLDKEARSSLKVNLALPAPFDSVVGDGVTGDITLRASNAPATSQATGLKIHIEDASLGIAEIKTFDIDGHGTTPSRLFGATEILLPVIGSGLA